MKKLINLITLLFCLTAIILTFMTFTIRIFNSRHQGCYICGKTENNTPVEYLHNGKISKYYFDEKHYTNRPESIRQAENMIWTSIIFLSPLLAAIALLCAYVNDKQEASPANFLTLFISTSIIAPLAFILLLKIYIALNALFLILILYIFLMIFLAFLFEKYKIKLSNKTIIKES